MVTRSTDAKDIERFWGKVAKTRACWNWLAAVNRSGYGVFKVGARKVLAHRFAYQLQNNAIPVGFVIDHLCRNRRCVNPAHMEVVTIGENTVRGGRAAQTHCKRGHSLNDARTVHRSNGRTFRVCRTCAKEQDAARRQQRTHRERPTRPTGIGGAVWQPNR